MYHKPFGGRVLPEHTREAYSSPPSSLVGLRVCGFRKGGKRGRRGEGGRRKGERKKTWGSKGKVIKDTECKWGEKGGRKELAPDFDSRFGEYRSPC